MAKKKEYLVTMRVSPIDRAVNINDIRNHIHDQVKVVGHLHPDDPIFEGIEVKAIKVMRLK